MKHSSEFPNIWYSLYVSETGVFNSDSQLQHKK